MNYKNLVNVLIEYSKNNKPFRIEIVKDKSKILSLSIIDYPVLKKWKSIDKTFSEYLRNCGKSKPGVNFLSLSKKNRIFIPCSKAKHLQESSKKYTKNEQLAFWKFVFDNSKNAKRIFTEGSEVGYLHVKV